MSYLDATDPPGYVIHGDRDRTVDVVNGYDIHNRAARGGFGANVCLDIVEGYGHGPVGGANTAALDSWLSGL